MPDTYIGEKGTSWLDHWAITRGKPPRGYPVFPPSIDERYKAVAATTNTTNAITVQVQVGTHLEVLLHHSSQHRYRVCFRLDHWLLGTAKEVRL